MKSEQNANLCTIWQAHVFKCLNDITVESQFLQIIWQRSFQQVQVCNSRVLLSSSEVLLASSVFEGLRVGSHQV